MDFIPATCASPVGGLVAPGVIFALGIIILIAAPHLRKRGWGSLRVVGVAFVVVGFVIGLVAVIGPGEPTRDHIEAYADQIEETYGLRLGPEQMMELDFPATTPDTQRAFGTTAVSIPGSDQQVDVRLVWDGDELILHAYEDGRMTPLATGDSR